MHEAALLGRKDIIQLLLDHRTEINSRTDDARSPLSEAIRGKHEDVAEFRRPDGGIVSKLNDSPGPAAFEGARAEV